MTHKFSRFLSVILLFALIVALFFTMQKTYFLIFPPVATVKDIPILSNAAPKSSLDISRIPNVPLFGKAQEPAREAVVASSYRLQGIFWAQEEKQRYALIEPSSGKSKLYTLGEEISPGVNLIEISPDQVIIDNQGQQELLKLPKGARSG